MMKQKRKKTNAGLFLAAFAVIVAITIFNNFTRKKTITLKVLDNSGVSGLETVDNSIVCTFQDGRIVTWDWNSHVQNGDFNAASGRTVLLESQELAAVDLTDQKMLTVYSIPTGQKQQEMSVGWSDQDVQLRVSSDKNVLVLIRKNPPVNQDQVFYEFLTVDIGKKILSPSITKPITQNTEDYVDFVVDNQGVIYAVGSINKEGRITAIDINTGTTKWDQVFTDTDEFCSAIVTSDTQTLYAGNRDGLLYKINAESGDTIKQVRLLEEGETRPITNDYSVLNLAFSPDGRYYVATINPKAYILKSETDEEIDAFSPADRLVSKIAFSPDNKYVATSDIRAGYPIKIWPLLQK